MKRAWVLAIIVGLLILQIASGSSNVMTDRCVNGTCEIVAQTSPWAIMAAVACLAVVIFHRPLASSPAPEQKVRLRSRVAAFFIDIFAGFSIVGPLSALPMVLYVALASGSFWWGARISGPNVWEHLFAVVLVLGAVLGLFVYFYAPQARGRRTLGQYVMGYRVERIEGRTVNYVVLGLLTFVGVCAWPVSMVLALLRPDREFWWSLKSGVRAVRLAPTT